VYLNGECNAAPRMVAAWDDTSRIAYGDAATAIESESDGGAGAGMHFEGEGGGGGRDAMRLEGGVDEQVSQRLISSYTATSTSTETIEDERDTAEGDKENSNWGMHAIRSAITKGICLTGMGPTPPTEDEVPLAPPPAGSGTNAGMGSGTLFEFPGDDDDDAYIAEQLRMIDDAELQAAIASSLMPSHALPSVPGKAEYWKTLHTPKTQFECSASLQGSVGSSRSSSDGGMAINGGAAVGKKIFGQTACCIIATIAGLKNVADPNLIIRVVKEPCGNAEAADGLPTDGSFDGSSIDDGSAEALPTPTAGRGFWASMIQIGVNAYIVKLQQEQKTDAVGKPLFYVNEILDLALKYACKKICSVPTCLLFV
jgi:hypothetical protein